VRAKLERSRRQRAERATDGGRRGFGRWRSPAAGGASKAARPKEIVNLSDLDDDEEIRNVLLTEEEVQAKSALWMEANKDYLEQQEGAVLKRQAVDGVPLSGLTL